MSKRIAVQFVDVHYHFGAVRALDGVNLEIRDGELFSILGPSGSGKTTCLRLIAGLETPTSGSIVMYGQDATYLPPADRHVSMLFQEYALYPHMNVADNVGYGLKVKKVPGAERDRRVKEILEVVQLQGLEKNKPSQLSGGQRQRVGLARALVTRPRVLLLDEPLGALDLKIRRQMQQELKAIQKKLGITFVFITHEQQEAFSMSDRIAVLNQGKVEQVGTPMELREQPATHFIAGFVGTNIVSRDLSRQLMQREGTYVIHPEKIQLVEPDLPTGDNVYCVGGTIRDLVFLGATTRYTVTLDTGGEMIVIAQNRGKRWEEVSVQRGRKVSLVWRHEDSHELRG